MADLRSTINDLFPKSSLTSLPKLQRRIVLMRPAPFNWSSSPSFKTFSPDSGRSISNEFVGSKVLGTFCRNGPAHPSFVHVDCASRRISPRILNRHILESQQLRGEELGTCVTRSIGYVGSLSMPNGPMKRLVMVIIKICLTIISISVTNIVS